MYIDASFRVLGSAAICKKMILGNAKKHGERAGIYATHVMEDTERSWRSVAQSFLKGSCIGSIDSPSSPDFTFKQRAQEI